MRNMTFILALAMLALVLIVIPMEASPPTYDQAAVMLMPDVQGAMATNVIISEAIGTPRPVMEKNTGLVPEVIRCRNLERTKTPAVFTGSAGGLPR